MPSDPPDTHAPTPGGPDRAQHSDDELLVPFGAPPADASGGEGDTPPPGPGRGGTPTPGGRGRRRRARSALRPLWWSMPIVVVLALAAIFLTGLHVWSAASVRAYLDTGYDRARTGFEGQLSWTRSGPEAWVADYNLGSTLLVQGYLDVGVAHLERAMETVPRATEVAPGYIESYSYECRVRTNLALGLEGQGDALAADLEWAGAADLYERSSDLLSPCRSIDTSQPQSGDPQSGSDGGEDGEPQSGSDGGEDAQPQSGQDGGASPEPSDTEGGSSGGGSSGEPGADPSSGPSGDSSGEPGTDPSAEPSTDPSGATGTGQQGDPGEEAESAKDRLDGKARDARERAEGRSPSPQSSGDPSPEPSAAPSGEPSSGSSPHPTPSGDSTGSPSGDPTPTPSASPTPDPFGNETDQQRRRRQELERQLEQSRSDQGNSYDQNRSGLPNGGW